MEIGEKLRNRRLNLGLSRNQLAQKIHVTPSAIANYENGVSYPKPDILISLIIALEVDANYLYQDYLANSKIRTLYGQELTSEEKDAISKYRELTEDGKRLVRMIINEEYERGRNEEWLEYPCLQPRIRKLNSGFLILGEDQKIRVKKKHIIPDMDFCFQVQIDRYEPVFKKYDVLALKGTPAQHNEMGIFHLNGVHYLRTLYHTQDVCKLCSLNVNEPDVEVNPEDHFRCVGTILGRIYGTCELITVSEGDDTR